MSPLGLKLRRMGHTCNAECEPTLERHREPWMGVVIGDGTFRIGVPVRVTLVDVLRFLWHSLVQPFP